MPNLSSTSMPKSLFLGANLNPFSTQPWSCAGIAWHRCRTLKNFMKITFQRLLQKRIQNFQLNFKHRFNRSGKLTTCPDVGIEFKIYTRKVKSLLSGWPPSARIDKILRKSGERRTTDKLSQRNRFWLEKPPYTTQWTLKYLLKGFLFNGTWQKSFKTTSMRKNSSDINDLRET